IQRARLFEAEQHRRQEAETLREAALALTTTLDRNQVIEHILAQLQQVVPYDTASVQLLRGDRLEIVGGRGFPNLDDLLGISFPIDGDNPNREVVRTRTPFIVEDAPAVYEEFRREPHAQADIRSWLGVPMLVGERLVGMITLDKHEPGFYTPEHARLAEAFAAQAAIAIENARLYEEARGHADKLAALYETSQHITSTLELDALLQLIAERSVQLTGADKSLILLVDTEMGKLIKAAGFGFTPGQIESFTYQEVQDGISGWVLRERTPTISEDILTDPRNTGLALEMAKKEPERGKSIAVAPLTITGEVIGTLTVVNNVGRPVFSQSDLDLVVMLANQAAIAIENSRLFQATQRQADELARLHKAAVAISSSLELSEVLRTLAKQVGRALDTSSAYICDWDEETDQSTVLAEWINPEATASEPDLGARYDLRRYPTTLQALQERQPLAVQATDPDLDPADRESAERYGWKSYLIIPLVIQDRAIGYVELWETRWKREFTEADVRLCQTLAADAAGAIERARLFQAEREQRELAEALAEAAAAISSTLNLDQVLDRILEQVERVVAGDAFNIMLVEDDNVRVVRWRGYEHLGVEDRISRFVIPIAEYPNLVKMVRTGEPVVIPDTASDPEWVLVEGWEWLRSYVAAPIQVGGLAVGFLCVDGTRPGQFGPADARRLQAFADHAATAIENAQLYREVLNHAEWLEERVQERTAQLQAQYARLDAILRSTTDGIVVTDEQGEIIQANP
nr:GAF domain-containing protein [Anaerolineae bacterium]